MSKMRAILQKDIPYTFTDSSLLENRAFIGGKWVTGCSSQAFPVYDPADDKVVCEVADMGREDTVMAIEAASSAFRSFRKTTCRQRRQLVRRWADLICDNENDLAAICTVELGKPFTESLVTVRYGIDFLAWFESAIERQFGDTIPAAKRNNRILTIRQPQGVVAAITPWNSPIAMVTRKVGAAIAAGNTVVCKPAPETPLCALALAKLFERAGGPPGVFNVVTSSAVNAGAIGEVMSQHPAVRHLSFTGSTAVGKHLHVECAKHFKRTSMELGGNAPFLVFDDANIEKAVEGLIASKFRSSGQTCVCANRIYVQSSVIDKFVSILQRRVVEQFRFGSVWDPSVNFGPLYSKKAFGKIEQQISDAVAKGAKIIHGGNASDHSGELGANFFPPSIVIGCTKDMLCMHQETFGPVAFLSTFETEEEVIKAANNVDVGLASYFYTESFARSWRVSEALEVGMVGVGVGLISACEQPFGGIKESGVGREGGKDALDEYTEVKSITIGL